jgi:hypothetical protein
MSAAAITSLEKAQAIVLAAAAPLGAVSPLPRQYIRKRRFRINPIRPSRRNRARMAAMVDYEQIRALTYEYTFRLDRGDFAGVSELLAAATLRMAARGMDSSELRGRDEIERFYAGQVVTYDGDPRTRHIISNHVVELAEGGESAKGRSYFTVLQAAPKQPIQTVVCGRYADAFVRDGSEWRFDEKVIEVDYLTAIGDHFVIDDEHAARRS